MALPSAYRLKHRRDFSHVYRRGTRVAAKYFVIRALRRPSRENPSQLSSGALPMGTSREPLSSLNLTQQSSKIGVAVSLKVSKRAVVRNRIRRQVQAAMQQLMPRLPSGWLILVSARPAAVECDYWQFLRELEELLTRAEVIHGHSGRGVL